MGACQSLGRAAHDICSPPTRVERIERFGRDEEAELYRRADSLYHAGQQRVDDLHRYEAAKMRDAQAALHRYEAQGQAALHRYEAAAQGAFGKNGSYLVEALPMALGTWLALLAVHTMYMPILGGKGGELWALLVCIFLWAFVNGDKSHGVATELAHLSNVTRNSQLAHSVEDMVHHGEESALHYEHLARRRTSELGSQLGDRLQDYAHRGEQEAEHCAQAGLAAARQRAAALETQAGQLIHRGEHYAPAGLPAARQQASAPEAQANAQMVDAVSATTAPPQSAMSIPMSAEVEAKGEAGAADRPEQKTEAQEQRIPDAMVGN